MERHGKRRASSENEVENVILGQGGSPTGPIRAAPPFSARRLSPPPSTHNPPPSKQAERSYWRSRSCHASWSSSRCSSAGPSGTATPIMPRTAAHSRPNRARISSRAARTIGTTLATCPLGSVEREREGVHTGAVLAADRRVLAAERGILAAKRGVLGQQAAHKVFLLLLELVALGAEAGPRRHLCGGGGGGDDDDDGDGVVVCVCL